MRSFEGYTCLFFASQLQRLWLTHCKYRIKFKTMQQFIEQISTPVWKEK
ncbi:hypothetical protein [Porphyromonas phage phage005b_ATCC49417]|uniref:Uncharacterized protein n=1 Tax=Porphyromonas phage phage005a_ATCC49417 TaxID=3154097 RepID=A0AAT9J7X7_9VIRU